MPTVGARPSDLVDGLLRELNGNDATRVADTAGIVSGQVGGSNEWIALVDRGLDGGRRQRRGGGRSHAAGHGCRTCALPAPTAASQRSARGFELIEYVFHSVP